LHDGSAHLDCAGFHASDFRLVPPWRTLAGQETAPTARKRQQRAKTDKIDT
jgi:hypothetical protein